MAQSKSLITVDLRIQKMVDVPHHLWPFPKANGPVVRSPGRAFEARLFLLAIAVELSVGGEARCGEPS